MFIHKNNIYVANNPLKKILKQFNLHLILKKKEKDIYCLVY
jgi:hypothetical protein